MTESSAADYTDKPRLAVVGAGVAGLVCARELLAQGSRVKIFERAGSVGGRLAAWSTEGGDFDAGAQYLTVQNEAFADEVRRWVGADLLRTWDAQIADLSNGQGTLLAPTTARFVGVPAMQSIAGFLARGLDVALNTTVGRIERTGRQWMLHDAQGAALDAAGFDGLVLAIPSVDALPLVRAQSAFAPALESVRWDACWTACLCLSRASNIEFDGAFINDDPILAWAARENSKPLRRCGSGVGERWLLQARPNWSNNFVDLPHEEAARWMQRAFAARLARPLAQKTCVALRWHAAAPAEPLTEAYLWDPERAIGMAGDWCGGARIESAFLSGMALARAIAA
jgi:predicted NAD/FAD-dependent oxidoreductase